MNPKRKTTVSSSTQIAVRLEADLLKRIDRAQAALSPRGIELARAEVIRAAITRGLAVIEAEELSGAGSAQFNTRALQFEMALRDIHGCERGGASGDADADVYRSVTATDDWRPVARAIGRAISKVEKLVPQASLAGARETLSNQADIGAAFTAMTYLLQAIAETNKKPAQRKK